MNGGPSAPTTADYANSSANSALHEIDKLKKRVEHLEAIVQSLVLRGK